ncbi:hypothetical protein U7230_02325 [Carboxydochorda subterranea]|uniref:Uncharacterized protein n=1 Tax=Carboxydichorda subterranea TaxID=3109565 RepID=A0ABZ1BYR4_9FIRM|nr:hypothetical protein [Limnochorda sp. L945t]WRP17869.1 hypothetical protein U7230_02325 [Limnochorda sp. L945t]
MAPHPSRRPWTLPPLGEALVDPPAPALAELAARNAEALEAERFDVGGVPAAELRGALRQAALAIGTRQARRYGWWEGPSAGNHATHGPVRPLRWMVTGHQPILAHPGIVVKNALIGALARTVPGAVAVNVVVDYDTAAQMAAPVPVRKEGRLTVEPVTLAPVGYGYPFCQVPAPGASELDAFASGVVERLATLGQPGESLIRRFLEFMRVAAAPPRTGGDREAPASLAEWVTAARHRFEAMALGAYAEYLEVPAGELTSTWPFRLFFADVALRAREFALIHNETLAAYRSQHHIRSRANPFPDLLVEPAGGRVELPFWILTPGLRRRKLYARQDRSRRDALELSTVDGPVAELPLSRPDGARELAEALERAGLAIRPRAVTLTLFVRLFLADLFVHGVGGARYDRVTDAVARRFYGIEPPPYAVASMSLALADLPRPEIAEPPDQLRRQLRDLRFNPQRWVAPGEADDTLARLAEEKRRLVRAIQQPGAPRRALTRQIEQVNAALSERLEGVRVNIEARLRQATLAVLERQASDFRGYPVFFYDPLLLRRAIEEAISGRRLAPCAGDAPLRGHP